MSGPHKQLGQVLLEMKLIDQRKLDEALDQQRRVPGTKIGKAMLDMGFIDEVQLTKALCRQFHLPFVDLSRARLSDEVVALVPADVVENFGIVPVKLHQGKLILATDDPMVTFTADDLRFVLNRELTFALTPPTALNNVRAEAYGLGEKVEIKKKRPGEAEEEEDDDAPIIRLVHEVMEQALAQRASDIHVEPMEDRVRVRYRVDGVCYEAHSLDRDLSGPVITRLKVMAKMDIAEHRKPQDGRIAIKLLGRPIDLRVSLVPSTTGESIVMRILDRETGLIDLDTLGFVGDDRDRFDRIIKRPNGIFLVTGPTGSGKTTTLYAALKTLNKPNVKIITAENPVEYLVPGINQAEVRHGIGLDFARILRAMLRQAPNIILVGEIRDKETAEIAIQAALTGHLVFSTLHTNDAPSALTRLIDMGVKPFLASTAVMAVMAQRLARRLCLSCRQPYEPAPGILSVVGIQPGGHSRGGRSTAPWAAGSAASTATRAAWACSSSSPSTGRSASWSTGAAAPWRSGSRRDSRAACGASGRTASARSWPGSPRSTRSCASRGPSSGPMRRQARHRTCKKQGSEAVQPPRRRRPRGILATDLPTGGNEVDCSGERHDQMALLPGDIHKLFDTVVETGASDLHITKGRPPVLRLKGRLRNINVPALSNEDCQALISEIIPPAKAKEFEEVGSADFGFAHEDKARFRVAVFKQKGNAAMVCRLIPNDLLTFEQIGLSDSVIKLLERPRGLLLVTGPTGSGKTTTLATMIDWINQNRDAPHRHHRGPHRVLPPSITEAHR